MRSVKAKLFFVLCLGWASLCIADASEDDYRNTLRALLKQTDVSIQLTRKQILNSQAAPFLPDLYGYKYEVTEYPHNGKRCFDFKVNNFAIAEPTRNLFRFFIIKNNTNGIITLEVRQIEITEADIVQTLNTAEFLFSEMQPL